MIYRFEIKQPGIYVEIAGRSKNYILDRWILYTGSSSGLSQYHAVTGYRCQ